MAEVDKRTPVLPVSAIDEPVLSVTVFEAGPPANLIPEANPDDSIATTKEEEWVTKKKTEVTTKRQIETRVKRQLVLEDGKVVEDSGPMVTTNTTEDTEKQQHNHTERRILGDEPRSEMVPTSSGVVKEVQEKTVKSREETEELLETEDIQHLGDISDEGYKKAVTSSSGDVRQALQLSNRQGLIEHSPKIVHQSSKSKKIVDTEEKRQVSEVQADGKVVTETKRTTQHEETRNANVPDDEHSDGGSVEEAKKESSHRYRKTKNQNLTEYRVNGLKIGQKVKYQGETSEAERYGDPASLDQVDSVSTRLRRIRLRSQDHKLAIEGAPTVERKDVITRKPLNFDQEEETRKKETSKWLEHHFGSDSTRSSVESLDNLTERTPVSKSNFISVTMKSQPIQIKNTKTSFLNNSDEDRPFKPYNSLIDRQSTPKEETITYPKCGSPSDTGYFRGISHWTSRKTDEKRNVFARKEAGVSSPSPIGLSPPPADSPSPVNLITSHRINPVTLKNSFTSEPNSFEREHNADSFSKWKVTSNDITNYRDPTPSSLSTSPHLNPESDRPSPPVRKKHKELDAYKKIGHDFRVWNRPQKMDEPKPDYSPPSRSPSPMHDDYRTMHLPTGKKLHQRTRFAADIPPPPQTREFQVKQKRKIGDSFRKFVDRLRSTSSERKNKKRNKKGGSRSPSPRENTYQNYNIVDSNIPCAATRVGRKEMGEPVAPPRGRTYKLDNGSLVDSGAQTSMERRSVQRYYLGEDPFSGSIYGREREYDGVVPIKTSRRNRSSRKSDDEVHSSVLGRLSKSTSRLVGSEVRTTGYDYDRRGVQTLPRKLRTEPQFKKPVETQRSLGETTSLSPNHWEYSRNYNSSPYTGSLINVSFVNNKVSPPSSNIGHGPHNGIALNGPAKPARTYRSNLLRSKSFNVRAGELDSQTNNTYKSNPQLHRLEESPPPLKSPQIISSLNRSSKDLTDEGFNFSKVDEKRKLFMKGFLDRAPELFKTLHGDELEDSRYRHHKVPISNEKSAINYSNSFRSTSTANTVDSGRHVSSPYKSLISSTPSFREITRDGNVTKSIVRRGTSDDDYSETVRISSRSDDPLRPSETNTVKTFSKKTLPSKSGLSTETVESQETKTVVKSRYLGDSENRGKSSRNSPNGIAIETRSYAK